MKRQVPEQVGSSLAKDNATVENTLPPKRTRQAKSSAPFKNQRDERSASEQAKCRKTETDDHIEPDAKSRRGNETSVLPECGDQSSPPATNQSQSAPQASPAEAPVLHPSSADRASAVLRIEREMCSQLPRAPFVSGKVAHVYSPLEYAAAPHADYVRRCLSHGGGVPFLLVGMNPGPWGMTQTGVPFGEIAAVRDWMGVRGEVVPPDDQHPERPITGFGCTRSEVSGRRLWGLWQRLSGTPDRLFRHVFVHNFCPLAFVQRSGKNLTPNCLSAALRQHLEPVCQKALIEIIQVLGAHTVVGIGKYAEDQTRKALSNAGMTDRVAVYRLLHPSPSNPQANKNWDEVAVSQLQEAGVLPLP